jgi:general secretion pathway protein G
VARFLPCTGREVQMQKRASFVKVVRDRGAGFTLLEIMIVLVIIAAIATTIGISVYRRWHDSQIKLAQIQVRETVGHVAHFLLMRNRCPTLDDLVAEHYIKQAKDPWGTSLQLRCPSEHQPDVADIVSFGPDRASGTEDDIKSWQPLQP